MRIALVIAVLLAVACSREDPGDVSQQTPPQASTTTGASPQASSTMTPPIATESDNPAATPTPAPATREVHLLEYSIHMPDTLPAGHLTFRIENAGKEAHGFEIEGNGVEQRIDKIQRGDTKTLDVDLKPGTYTIYCPVDGHKGKGMTKTITVK
jgi:hypothetical protein